MLAELASLAGSAMEVGGSMYASAKNMELARDQMRFQERMSSTAHQREVADLRAAGLNPILSALRGGGASTPSGASPNIENPAKGLGSNIASAMRLRNENALLESQRAKLDADTQVSVKQLETMDANMALQKLQGLLTTASADMTRAKIPEELAKAQLWKMVEQTIRDLMGSDKPGQTLPGGLRHFLEKLKGDLGEAREPAKPGTLRGGLNAIERWGTQPTSELLKLFDIEPPSWLNPGQNYGGQHSAKGRR